MKLQRWSRHNGRYVKTTNGPWIKASDVEPLLKILDKLKCCGNCKHNYDADEENCQGCCEPKLQKWEMME
jgi:hypothetical protein